MKIKWTEELMAEMKQLASKGKSGGQIALKLGLTRSAVIGKMSRLKIPLTGVARGGRAPGMPHRKKAILNVHVEEPVKPLPTNVTLPELDPSGCKWPIGDPATSGFVYCNQRRSGRHSYCEAHCRIAFRPDNR